MRALLHYDRRKIKKSLLLLLTVEERVIGSSLGGLEILCYEILS